MCGNSLIDEFEGIKLIDESLFESESDSKGNGQVAWQISMFQDQINTITEELFKEQDRLFDEEDNDKKIQIKKHIDDIIDSIIKAKLSKDNNQRGMEKYKESLQQKTKPYFLWKLEFAKIFKEKGGFDIVIGNPPYLKEIDNKHIFETVINTTFGAKHSEGKMNYWYFFFYKGLEILNSNGHLSFIAPNYFISGTGATKLNTTIINNTTLKLFIDFNKAKVFETADIQCMIILIQNCIDVSMNSKNIYLFRKNIKREEIGKNISIIDNNENVVHYLIYNQKPLLTEDYKINFEYAKYGEILSKINRKKSEKQLIKATQGIVENPSCLSKKVIQSLGEMKIDVSGFTVGEEVFVIRKENIASLSLNKKEEKFLREYHGPYEIQRFKYSKDFEKYLLYITKDNMNDITKFPNLYKHLIRYKPFMEVRRETKKGSNEWFHLHWPRKEFIFRQEKILYPQMCAIPQFAYCDIPYYVNMSTNLIYCLREGIDIIALTAILNSKLSHFWLLHNAKNRGIGLDIAVSVIDKFPINESILSSVKLRLISEEITSKINNNEETSELEERLNKEVYTLYNIQDREIDIIETYINERVKN
jgi:adenine-specific DNA-methyltransferase